MSQIKCDRTNCEFNSVGLCTTDIEVSGSRCITYKETESSKRSRFYYTQMEMKDIGSFIFVIKHDIYVSLDAMLDIIVKDMGIPDQKIIMDLGYSHGLKNSGRFICLELNPNKSGKGYEVVCLKSGIDRKTELFLSVKTREFFYNNQQLIENSIWCREEQEMMKKRGAELLDYLESITK